MRPRGHMRILMGLLKCGLNSNKTIDLSMNYKKKRGKGTKAQRHKAIKGFKGSWVQVKGKIVGFEQTTARQIKCMRWFALETYKYFSTKFRGFIIITP